MIENGNEPEEVKNNVNEEPSDTPGEKTEGQLGDNEQVVVDGGQPKAPGKIKRLLHYYLHHKKWTLPLTALVIVAVIFAIPMTRYKVLGYFWKQEVSFLIIDAQTHQPISNAAIELTHEKSQESGVFSGSDGKVTTKLPVGQAVAIVKKKYYKTTTHSFLVTLSKPPTQTISLTATGRQVPIKVVNKITGKPVAQAVITAADTSSETDKNGEATIVLPADKANVEAEIKVVGADDYNTATVTVKVSSQPGSANTFAITPAGRIYFLSNLSGKLDVVSTNLDGSGRKTVVAGTGSEDANNTVLLASRDWKYLALLSKRAGGQYAKLYLISTTDDKLSTIEEGNTYFTPTGWSGHSFVYETSNNDVRSWQPGKDTLKSFNAETAKLTTIDQTNAQGTQPSYKYQSLFANLVNDKVVYGLSWYTYSDTLDGTEKNSILSASADGTNKKDLRDITIPAGTTYSNMGAVLAKPQILYIATSIQSQPNVYYTYQYENNSVTQSTTLTDDAYYKAQQAHATYLISPGDKQTFWTEVRDGKNTLFVGDYEGNNPQQVASLSDYSPYGWYTDDYLLVQKSDSELYILPSSGGTALKISDYYKPPYSFYGYGGGYGGL